MRKLSLLAILVCVLLSASAWAVDGKCVNRASNTCILDHVTTGDAVFAAWFNNSATTAPTLPATGNWVKITSRATNAGMLVACHYATSGSDTTIPAPAANGTAVEAVAYLGTASVTALAACAQAAGNASQNGSATSTTANYPAANQERSVNWFIGFMFDKTAATCTPTGMTLISGASDDTSTPALRVSDTNGAASGNWPSTNCTVTSGSTRVTAVIELVMPCSAVGLCADDFIDMNVADATGTTLTPAAAGNLETGTHGEEG
jgi:hypothetical protein